MSRASNEPDPDFGTSGPYVPVSRFPITIEEFIKSYSRYWRWDDLREVDGLPSARVVGVRLSWQYTSRVRVTIDFGDWYVVNPNRPLPSADDGARRLPVKLWNLTAPEGWPALAGTAVRESPWLLRTACLQGYTKPVSSLRYVFTAVPVHLRDPKSTENLQAEINAACARCIAEGAKIL